MRLAQQPSFLGFEEVLQIEHPGSYHDHVCIESRGRHTSFKCDWSSDVCSSDLRSQKVERPSAARTGRRPESRCPSEYLCPGRSEERRVGKEWRSRWSPYH